MSRGFFAQEPDDLRHDRVTADDLPACSRNHEAEFTRAGSRPRAPRSRPARPTERSRTESHAASQRAVYYDRDQGYRLSDSEVHAMAELARFRVIAARDLARHTYAGCDEKAELEVENLVRMGLVRKATFEGPEASPRKLLTLTQRGNRLVRVNRFLPDDQATYYGFVKPKESNHDADLYLLYEKEAARIEQKGGTNLRVILDYELKQKVNRDMAHFGTAARQEIGERYGLRVVGQKIPIPDLRIEYETRSGDIARADLELITEHYREQSIMEKIRAGFALYTPHGEADHLRRVFDAHELTLEILSL